MRALIGAIIAAGALIGLGLTNVGIGMRYAGTPWRETDGVGAPADIKFHLMDHTLQYSVILLTALALIGLGVAFVGLMYHHERRFREAQLAGSDTRTVP